MDIEDIELKSEEIQEILSRPPHALIRWGITVFFMVISFLFIGGCFFSYPDTVEAGITITTENPPAWIVARSTGKLKEVFLKDKQKVKAGELIGVVNNPADTREVLLLKKELEAFQISDSMICQDHFTGRLTLGEIQSAYTGFIKSLTEYRDFLKLDLYKEKEEAARRELNEYQIYISHLHNEVNLNKEELKLALSSYSREEILYKKGLVSASDYEKEQQAYLASKRGTEQMRKQTACKWHCRQYTISYKSVSTIGNWHTCSPHLQMESFLIMKCGRRIRILRQGIKYFLLWRKIRGLSSARQSCLFPTRAK